MIRRMFGMVAFFFLCFVCNDSCAMSDKVVVSINSKCSFYNESKCSFYDGLIEVSTDHNPILQFQGSIDTACMPWMCEYSLPIKIIAFGLPGVACCSQITKDIDCSNYSSDDIPQCVKTEKKDCKQNDYSCLSLREIKRHQKRIKLHQRIKSHQRKQQKLNKYYKNKKLYIKIPQHKSFKNSKKIR